MEVLLGRSLPAMALLPLAVLVIATASGLE